MTLYTNTKYLEWMSAEEMHEATKQWLSELEFIGVESHFLDELLGLYFIKLSSGKNYQSTIKLTERLISYKEQIPSYINQIKTHQNALLVLLDEVDQPYEEREIKGAHKEVQQKVKQIVLDFKELKKDIFHLVYTIIKKSKLLTEGHQEK